MCFGHVLLYVVVLTIYQIRLEVTVINDSSSEAVGLHGTLPGISHVGRE